MKNKVVVIGASENPSRYSYICITRLVEKNYPVVAIGKRAGTVAGVAIVMGKPEIANVHTVTIYLSLQNQASMEDYILSLSPKRIIFNPGAENRSFAERAERLGIATEEACTIVMLTIGAF